MLALGCAGEPPISLLCSVGFLLCSVIWDFSQICILFCLKSPYLFISVFIYHLSPQSSLWLVLKAVYIGRFSRFSVTFSI